MYGILRNVFRGFFPFRSHSLRNRRRPSFSVRSLLLDMVRTASFVHETLFVIFRRVSRSSCISCCSRFDSDPFVLRSVVHCWNYSDFWTRCYTCDVKQKIEIFLKIICVVANNDFYYSFFFQTMTAMRIHNKRVWRLIMIKIYFNDIEKDKTSHWHILIFDCFLIKHDILPIFSARFEVFCSAKTLRPKRRAQGGARWPENTMKTINNFRRKTSWTFYTRADRLSRAVKMSNELIIDDEK